LQHKIILKIYRMKKVKKAAASFTTLDASQMGKIKGGIWVNVTKPDGTVEPVWR
jgi:hypothetical protein